MKRNIVVEKGTGKIVTNSGVIYIPESDLRLHELVIEDKKGHYNSSAYSLNGEKVLFNEVRVKIADNNFTDKVVVHSNGSYKASDFGYDGYESIVVDIDESNVENFSPTNHNLLFCYRNIQTEKTIGKTIGIEHILTQFCYDWGEKSLDIYLQDNTTKSICPFAFYNNTNLTEVTLSNNIRFVGEGCFESSPIDYVVSNNCKYIKSANNNYCCLVEILGADYMINDNVQCIADDLKIATEVILNGDDFYNYIPIGLGNKLIAIAKNESISTLTEYTFRDNTKFVLGSPTSNLLKKIIIPNSVEWMTNFYGYNREFCDIALREVEIGSGLTHINNFLIGASNLYSVVSNSPKIKVINRCILVEDKLYSVVGIPLYLRIPTIKEIMPNALNLNYKAMYLNYPPFVVLLKTPNTLDMILESGLIVNDYSVVIVDNFDFNFFSGIPSMPIIIDYNLLKGNNCEEKLDYFVSSVKGKGYEFAQIICNPNDFETINNSKIKNSVWVYFEDATYNDIAIGTKGYLVVDGIEYEVEKINNYNYSLHGDMPRPISLINESGDYESIPAIRFVGKNADKDYSIVAKKELDSIVSLRFGENEIVWDKNNVKLLGQIPLFLPFKKPHRPLDYYYKGEMQIGFYLLHNPNIPLERFSAFTFDLSSEQQEIYNTIPNNKNGILEYNEQSFGITNKRLDENVLTEYGLEQAYVLNSSSDLEAIRSIPNGASITFKFEETIVYTNENNEQVEETRTISIPATHYDMEFNCETRPTIGFYLFTSPNKLSIFSFVLDEESVNSYNLVQPTASGVLRYEGKEYEIVNASQNQRVNLLGLNRAFATKNEEDSNEIKEIPYNSEITLVFEDRITIKTRLFKYPIYDCVKKSNDAYRYYQKSRFDKGYFATTMDVENQIKWNNIENGTSGKLVYESNEYDIIKESNLYTTTGFVLNGYNANSSLDNIKLIPNGANITFKFGTILIQATQNNVELSVQEETNLDTGEWIYEDYSRKHYEIITLNGDSIEIN